MRFILIAVAISVVLGVSAYGFMALTSQQKNNGGFTPIEVDQDGYAKTTLSKETITNILGTDDSLTIFGNNESALKVVVFYDYNCPYCLIEEGALEEALEGRDDIQVVLRPVTFMGQGSADIARLSMAAARMGKFPEFHEAVKNAQGRMDMNRAIQILSSTTQLPVEDLALAAREPLIEAAVRNNQQMAIEVGAHYVPAFVIGERIYMPLDRDTKPEDFQEMFDQELQRRG